MVQTRSYWNSDLVYPSGNEKRTVDKDMVSVTYSIKYMETVLLIEAGPVYR